MKTLGKLHFFLTLAGTYAIFMPMHYLGHGGSDAALLAIHRSRLPDRSCFRCRRS